MKSIVIIAGGMPPKNIPKADCYIGVDRGTIWLIRHNITPDIAIGDFDSVTKEERMVIKEKAKTFLKFSIKKDATDLELAIDKAIELRPKSVIMYGVLGGRFDHEMGAIQTLLKLESHNILGQIVDNLNKIMIVRRKMMIQKDARYRYVSIIPMGLSATVTLKGFKYNVSNKIFSPSSTLGISNEIPSLSAIIEVHKGRLLVVQSRD